MYEKIADINARVEDSVSGVRVVQSFTNEEYEISVFWRTTRSSVKLNLQPIKLWR